jgi:tRNA threonylcarbamoyladenosine biosynthesis protein TsaE
MEILFSIEQIHEVAKAVLLAKPNKIILFNGEMGVGKTTFIKALCHALGVQEATSSPTFSLVNEYKTDSGETVYHFDVYRLKNEHEAYDMGMDEYLYSNAWNFIEWAEKIPSLIPEHYSVIDLNRLSDGTRQLVLTNH